MYKSTIIYYTANRENPEFEEKIRANILKQKGNLPIISVSQKPINFGKNICVGDVGASGFNMFRQVQMACEAAKTQFVISAEADCLYPPDYFTFIPPRDDMAYRNSNVFLLPYQKNYFFQKDGSTFSQIIDREFYLKVLGKLFKNAPKWSIEEKNFPKERTRRSDIFMPDQKSYFETENPCLSFKTGNGMRFNSPSYNVRFYELPYWGKATELIKKYAKQ